MTRTLIATVESLDDVRNRSREAIEQALSGDIPEEDAPHRVSFETTDQLTTVFSARAIDLLRTIAREHPESMREAARLVDRDIKDVSRNLERLAEYDVIEFDQNGQSKRPIVPYDEIRIDLGIQESTAAGREHARV